MSHADLKRLLISYCVGFTSALALSLVAYFIVTFNLISSSVLTMAALLLLAVMQLVIQLVCFLHLGLDRHSRDRTISIGFTLIMMLVIVIGSLWVMRNLDYRMGMSPEAMDEYMIRQNKKGF